MTFNPLEQKGIPIDQQLCDWSAGESVDTLVGEVTRALRGRRAAFSAAMEVVP